MPPTIERFREVRGRSVALAAPLAVDDLLAQSMDDVSPTKWHLAHTTWYFERFVLARTPGYAPVDPRHDFLFNSYYDAVGPRHPRPRRSLITRPTLEDVWAYRAAVDGAMERLLAAGVDDALAFVIEVGLAHEEQHQELILSDIKHVLGTSLVQAAYRPEVARARGRAGASDERAGPRWRAFPEGLVEIGHDGRGFAFDNEGPRHRVFLEAFEIAERTITCGELCEFIADGGYRTPSLWVAEGWAQVQAEGWRAPLYWDGEGDERWLYTLHGREPIDPAAPACHLSWFEADAFARWAGARLPSEAEWETACAAALADAAGPECHDAGAPDLHPRPAEGGGLRQMLGSLWEWTASPYVAYPRYRPWEGALGEYNGKFMSSQLILRGGSCFTPPGHTRPTYRNFFPPAARWQMSGARLARWI